MGDPLTEAEITEEARLDDGLPQSLEACIRAYGLCHFKLKIGGAVEKDSERITAVLKTIASHLSEPNWRYTLDGNESYTSVAQVKKFWERLTAGPMRAEAQEHLLFIEQPLHRSIALSPEIRSEFAAWSNRPPFIIDESDGSLTDFPTALDLGYAGTSHKNCKGVFKGIANTCLARQRGAFISGEDLSNVGPVSLLQDLAVQAALGIESVERNGQHYFAGLSMFPAEVQQTVLTSHPDLYHASPKGFPTLTITRGEIGLGSVNAALFGLAADFYPAWLETL
jgi:hypothetical protein